ncbi:hypothetical protein D3C72_2123370 [compost metagenome]
MLLPGIKQRNRHRRRNEIRQQRHQFAAIQIALQPCRWCLNQTKPGHTGTFIGLGTVDSNGPGHGLNLQGTGLQVLETRTAAAQVLYIVDQLVVMQVGQTLWHAMTL